MKKNSVLRNKFPVFYLLLLFLIITSSDIQAQEVIEEDVYQTDSIKVSPQFVGGDELFRLYIKGNLKYPKEAAKKNLQGRVVVRFIVTKEGKIKDAHVMKSVYPLLDEEALRFVNSMPDWIPGELNGKPVNVYFTMPIVFKLPLTHKSNKKK